jgi:hypothetical protein
VVRRRSTGRQNTRIRILKFLDRCVPTVPTVRESAQPAQQNVQTVSRLEYDALRARSLAERLSDVLTKAIGSLASITFHVVWFTSTDIAAKSRSLDVAGFSRNGCLSLAPGDTGIYNPRVGWVLSGHFGIEAIRV